jgi:hypothetical protein
MVWILGQLVDEPHTEERRATPRMKMLLDTTTCPPPGHAVRILDISCSGMMVNSDADFAPGDRFAVELPEAGEVTAEVVWRRMTLLGCRFRPALPQAAVNAALLRSTRLAPPA